MVYEDLIGNPFVKSAKELTHHREGQGTRYVFLDDRVISNSNIYVICRTVKNVTEDVKSHVDMHKHNCDSAFLFLGDKENLEGLTCEVALEDERYVVSSPASVFIPAELAHSYRFINGAGIFVNIVLASNYQKSIKTL